MSGRAVAVLPATAVLLGACARGDPLAPPTVYFGEDACAVCSMIISDERYAAAVATIEEEGAPRWHLFDDVGCTLRFEQTRGEEIARSYVRDFGGRGWLALETSAYLHSRELRTPMAFGVAACADEPAARALAREHPGDVLDAPALRARFAAGRLTIAPGD